MKQWQSYVVADSASTEEEPEGTADAEAEAEAEAELEAETVALPLPTVICSCNFEYRQSIERHYEFTHDGRPSFFTLAILERNLHLGAGSEVVSAWPGQGTVAVVSKVDTIKGTLSRDATSID